MLLLHQMRRISHQINPLVHNRHAYIARLFHPFVFTLGPILHGFRNHRLLQHLRVHGLRSHLPRRLLHPPRHAIQMRPRKLRLLIGLVQRFQRRDPFHLRRSHRRARLFVFDHFPFHDLFQLHQLWHRGRHFYHRSFLDDSRF